MNWVGAIWLIGALAVWVALWIVAMDRFFDRGSKDVIAWLAAIACTILTIAGVAFILGEMDQDRQDCEDRGGTMVQTGTHLQPVGKTVVLMPVYECAIVKTGES